MTDAVGGVPYAFDDATLCLTTPGSATITDVSIVRPTGGLRVSSFSTLPARTGEIYNYLSNPRQRLAEVGFLRTGPMVVDYVCPDPVDGDGGGETPAHAGYSLLGFEVTKAANATATGQSLSVSYQSEASEFTIEIPFGIILCAPGKSKSSECDPLAD